MEVEIIVLDTATTKVEFLKVFLYDLPLLNKLIPLISMHFDIQVAMFKVSSNKINEKIRQLRVRHKSIRNLLLMVLFLLTLSSQKETLRIHLSKG